LKKQEKPRKPEQNPSMLGVYNNFPETVHGFACFTSSISIKGLQQVIVTTLQKLNNENFSLEAITDPSVPQCTVSFEFGIAEAGDFNYLDTEEADRTLKTIRKEAFQTMDFLCAIQYYRTKKESKAPLRFDYYMLRFTFNENLIRAQVFHERGPRHVTPEDLVNFTVNKLNETSTKKILKFVDSP
jgi:hypothetical protein